MSETKTLSSLINNYIFYSQKEVCAGTNHKFIKEIPSIGEMIKSGRERNGLTQAMLSTISTIPSTEISRLEAGKTKKPSKKVLRLLSPYTGIAYSQLLFYTGHANILEKDIYYSINGTIIPHLDIVADIYKADPNLLQLLENIDKLSLEDIRILEGIIIMMKSSSTSNKHDTVSEFQKTIQNMFDTIRSFLKAQLLHMLSFFIPNSQHA